MVKAVVKTIKVMVQEGVIHKLTSVIWLEIAFCYISCVIGTVYKYVVPGRVLWRFCLSHLLVPGFAAEKDGIHIEDHTSIVEQVVCHLLSPGKTCILISH